LYHHQNLNMIIPIQTGSLLSENKLFSSKFIFINEFACKYEYNCKYCSANFLSLNIIVSIVEQSLVNVMFCLFMKEWSPMSVPNVKLNLLFLVIWMHTWCLFMDPIDLMSAKFAIPNSRFNRFWIRIISWFETLVFSLLPSWKFCKEGGYVILR